MCASHAERARGIASSPATPSSSCDSTCPACLLAAASARLPRLPPQAKAKDLEVLVEQVLRKQWPFWDRWVAAGCLAGQIAPDGCQAGWRTCTW
jgi:hypothetical protein